MLGCAVDPRAAAHSAVQLLPSGLQVLHPPCPPADGVAHNAFSLLHRQVLSRAACTPMRSRNSSRSQLWAVFLSRLAKPLTVSEHHGIRDTIARLNIAFQQKLCRDPRQQSGPSKKQAPLPPPVPISGTVLDRCLCLVGRRAGCRKSHPTAAPEKPQ
jgi:hypothetical protein